MEIVNDVLSVVQEAVWTELERDLVLHAVASRYSHDQLLNACQLLVDWIGWRADLEDVVQNLFEGQHGCLSSCRSGAARAASYGKYKSPHFRQNAKCDSGGTEEVTGGEENATSRLPKSRIPVFKRPFKLATTDFESDDGDTGRGSQSESDSLSRFVFRNTAGCGAKDASNHGRNSRTRYDSKSECANNAEECCCQEIQDRDPNSRLLGRISLCEEEVSSPSSCCQCGATDGEDSAQVEVGENSSVPEGWVVLEGRHVAIPPVTVKIWKLIHTFWDILPQFVCTRTCFGDRVEEKSRVKKEIRGINVLLEQLSLRLSWALPVVRKVQNIPTASGADVSILDDNLDEELSNLKSWVVRVYEECLIGELNIPELVLPESSEARNGCESPLSDSIYSDASQDTDMDYFDASTSFLGDDQNGTSTYQPPVPTIQDDLLSWLWQAVKSDMDDELTVHLVASHYALQEVHHSRNILVSCGFSLPCMKGVRGLLMEMVGALRSVTDENNNNTVKQLPRFVCCDVSNRPSVRPVQSTCMLRDLEALGDTAQKLTTRICWLMPEAQRYSSAMEAAEKGSLAPQLSATSESLSNLKTILDWELGSGPKATCDPHARSKQDSCSVFPSAFQPLDHECKEVRTLGKLQCWGVAAEGYPPEPWGGGWLWGGPPGVFPALALHRDADTMPLPPPPPRPDVAEAMVLQSHMGHNYVAEPLHSPITTPQPPQRPWIPLAEPDRTKPSCIFTVMCYNVLCDKYATRQMYGYCPSWALEWEYRKKGIMDEIKHYLADIITLQEVETDQFFNFFLPELKSEGYNGIFSPKSRAKHMTENERKYVDGCAIFWRTSKFSLVKEHLIEFNQLAMANHDGSEDMLNRVMTKDNIGLAALLETKEAAWENSQLLPDKSQISQPVLVCTAHIHWDPEFCDVKLIQTIMLMSEIRQIITQIVEDSQHRTRSGHKMDPNSIQLLLCGDLNSLPDSGVVEFLTKGNVSMDHEDFKGFGYKTCLQKIAMAKTNNSLVNSNANIYTHSFKLSAAYDFAIMAYTNYTYDFKGIIDYIFHSSETMTALGVLGPIDSDWFKDNKVLGCPHPHIPSDHFPLLVQLEMRPASAAISQPNGLLHR